MASTSATEPVGVAAGRSPTQHRGFITSYGVGRVCAHPGCRTTLSRYNKSELCYPHVDELEARQRGDRSVG